MQRPTKIMTFDEWIASKGIALDAENILLLMEAWNQALFTACEEFGNREGTDFGIEAKYHVDKP